MSETITAIRVEEGGLEIIMIQVKVKKGESVDRALKRLKKVLDKEGMMKTLRNKRFYEKPSERLRKKSARARARTMSRR